MKAEFKIDEYCTIKNNVGNEGSEAISTEKTSGTTNTERTFSGSVVEGSKGPRVKTTTGTPNSPKPHDHNNADIDENNDWIMGIIIGTSVLVATIVIVVVACVLCSRKQKKKKETQADVNPVYDGGLDYEYDDMGNYDTMEDPTRKKREVKAEAVDRCSIYGEKEEGWEDAVVIDENPDYEG